ncbi:hypothetical protein Cfor_11977, partial [Coptotermes formosanus]
SMEYDQACTRRPRVRTANREPDHTGWKGSCIVLYCRSPRKIQGGLAQGGGPDCLDASQQGRDAQFTDQRDPRQSPYMATAYPSSERERPGMLHVSDQHQRHEEASRLRRRS